MGAVRLGRIGTGVGLIGIGLAVAGAFLARPNPPHPPTGTQGLRLAEAGGLRAVMVPPQAGLTALPAATTGRAAAAVGGYRHEWPGFHASARFRGTAVTLRFDDTHNRWRVTLDGKAVEVSRPGRQDLRIGGLAPGPHKIRAEKISESQGPAVFGGFFLDAAAQALPPPEPPPRLIEFIGDSDTLGLADTARRRDCTADRIHAATDTSRAFGPRVAAALGADYRIVARSGIGLLRNYGGAQPGRNMKRLYPLALPGEAAALSPTPTPTPTPPLPRRRADLVVLALGGNDFGSPLAPGEIWADRRQLRRDFGPALAGFAADRMRENPDAQLILLAFGEYGPELTGAYRDASRLLTAGGIGAHLVVLGRLRRTACLWHPSAGDHEMIARTLLAELAEIGFPRRD